MYIIYILSTRKKAAYRPLFPIIYNLWWCEGDAELLGVKAHDAGGGGEHGDEGGQQQRGQVSQQHGRHHLQAARNQPGGHHSLRGRGRGHSRGGALHLDSDRSATLQGVFL